MGVIGTYRAQISYLKRRHRKDAIAENDALISLQYRHMPNFGIGDSFQGQKRDIIAISLTHSNYHGEIGFLSDIRRMNVGLTRARRNLPVADSPTRSAHVFFVDCLADIKRIDEAY